MNRACATPPSARPTQTIAKSGATAITRLPTVYSSTVVISSGLRGSPAVTSVSGTASTATSAAYTVTSRPTVDAGSS